MKPHALPTPCYVVDAGALRRNLDILAGVRQRTGCRILLALKAFAMHRVFPLLRTALDGVCASSPDEARLGREAFGGEVHAYAAAFGEADMAALTGLCDHISFNSFTQWRRHRAAVQAAGRPIACGLRINPRHSEGRVPLYDPCAPGSRLGLPRAAFAGQSMEGISGLHFHTLCERNADALARTWAVVERDFADLFGGLAWLNFGGGHHITRADYDLDLLDRIVRGARDRYGVQVYLEPGEAVALDAGVFVTTVLDIVHNDRDIAILDASCTCHMPDVLEMPYRPRVFRAEGWDGSARPPPGAERGVAAGEARHTYRLAGVSCLAGDVIGDYAFDRPLAIGDRLVFEDMAIYTMVKNTTFNGIRLPSIALHEPAGGDTELVRTFDYGDFRDRLS